MRSSIFLTLLLLLAGCGGGAQVRLGDTVPAGESLPLLHPAGELVPPPGDERFTPTVMAVDPRGRLLVADQARGTIFLYDGLGPPAGWLAEPTGGSGAVRFQDIRSIVAATGLSLYVLDGGSGRVYAYDLGHEPQGEVLRLDSGAMTARFGRTRAEALAIDPSGQPYIADREGDRLLVFDPQWAPRTEIGGPGSAGGGFRDPAALAFGSGGRIWVADRGNRMIQRLDGVGSFQAEYPLDHAPESLATDGAGNLYVGDAAGFITLIGPGGDRSLLAPAPGRTGTVYLALTTDGRRLYAARPVAGLVEVYEIRAAAGPP